MSRPAESDMASILEFVQECRENMDQTERDVIQWEVQPDDRRVLDGIFRGFHTLKGTSGFLGYEQLESLAHQVESLLAKIRDEKLTVNDMAVNVILKVIDAVRLILKNLELTGEEGEGDYEVLVAELKLKTLHKQLLSTADLGEKKADAPRTEAKIHHQSVRVEVAALNQLRNLVEALKSLPPSDIVPGSRLPEITSGLQNVVTEMRLQPLEKSWGNLPRFVRDLGKHSGKSIRLEMSGEKIRIDAGLMSALKETLTHLIRNSVDHGIEKPDRRIAAGKDPEGCIQLRATHDDSTLTIEVQDDGAGIQPEILRERAIRDGFSTAEKLAGLETSTLLQLIFQPGFSTAREVTKLSGRGVGLDVVKTRLQSVGGTVSVSSEPGRGTLFCLTLPDARKTHFSDAL
jgi:two-component system chemotaxis sensor kinase CheA